MCFCVWGGEGEEFGSKEGSFLKVSECFCYFQWQFANRTLGICLVLESQGVLIIRHMGKQNKLLFGDCKEMNGGRAGWYSWTGGVIPILAFPFSPRMSYTDSNANAIKPIFLGNSSAGDCITVSLEPFLQEHDFLDCQWQQLHLLCPYSCLSPHHHV